MNVEYHIRGGGGIIFIMVPILATALFAILIYCPAQITYIRLYNYKLH